MEPRETAEIRSHPEDPERREGDEGSRDVRYHSLLRSFQSGFIASINAIFFLRTHLLIIFSRVIALTGSPNSSKYTR